MVWPVRSNTGSQPAGVRASTRSTHLVTGPSYPGAFSAILVEMRSVVVLATAVLGACSFSLSGGGIGIDADSDAPRDAARDGSIDSPIDAPPGPWLAGFTYRKPITITTTGTGMLQDFTVGIVRPADTDLAAHSNGTDLTVTAADMTTVLTIERVTFGAGGELELWVRIPMLALGAQTTVYLYYGGPASLNSGTAAWASSARGVWHLSDTSSNANDSTARAHHLAAPMTSYLPGYTAGVGGVGRARLFDGVDDRLEVADPADGSLDFGSTSFSVSLWARSTASVGPYDQPLYKGGTTGSLPGYCLFLGSSPWSGKIHDGSSFESPELSNGPLLNQWVHVALVVDRNTNTARAFTNGALITSVTFSLGSLNSAEPLRIGAGSGGARFQGSIDEVRIYDRVLSAQWIATEHANLMTPGFITVGPQQQM